MPLVLALHGFGGTSAFIEQYLRFKPLAEERGFIYALPEGTLNELGQQFWNATDACCGTNSTIDDATYLRAVIDDLQAKLVVDPQRIFIVGHSNGGFMAHKMACEHADVIAAIVSLAGATFIDPTDCTPSEPVSVLQVHGTADDVIFFDGGTYNGPAPYPSAPQTALTWSTYDECTEVGELTPFDPDPALAGDEAGVVSYAACANNTSVELWIMDGNDHAPMPTTSMASLIDFLFAHPKT